MDATLVRYISYVSVGAVLILWLRRKLYPKPYPGIPYNLQSATRIAGDIPDLIPVIEAKHEFSESLFAITTQNLGVPIAQMLFPGIRRPMIILEDPREIEDILLRRAKDFDKAAMAIDMFGPMFPNSTLAQYTTPELRQQKRLWADTMRTDFLRKVAAPKIVKSTLDLVELWRLKASIAPEQPFETLDDFKYSSLDAIWVAAVGEEPGVTRFEIEKLQSQVSGKPPPQHQPLGAFIRKEVVYINNTIAQNSSSPSPKWAQILETWTPRYRRSRNLVNAEVGRSLQAAIDRFQDSSLGNLEREDFDTCMVDLVLRRKILEARKSGNSTISKDVTQDKRLIDMLFVFLVAGHDSTANVLSWFAKFMEANPAVQTELRTILRAAFPGPDAPSADDILSNNLPYLDGVCEEAFRLAGAAKALLRQSIVDTEILGYKSFKVPKGSEVFMNLHINRQPASVNESERSATSQEAAVKLGEGNGIQGPAGRDLGSFEPRRWLVTDKTGKESFNAHSITTLAFGGGYRGCIGQKLARIEFRIVVVFLILNFEFLPLPEELQTTDAIEKVFREPSKPYARVRAL
ncbi:hypothetical protein VPNG_06819 [Cytospora leucostoma]|uniref:Cytochrome P450 n=1 Tax=Cytospora leucostoma TaxID=1230097 RepID=A0A423WVY3_9PEZI|nr:hypothetical protein VPNG_06819 [Cytospora leucostoma]